MAKNYLLIYSEQLATDIELLCQNIKASSNTLFQNRYNCFSNICSFSYWIFRAKQSCSKRSHPRFCRQPTRSRTIGFRNV